MSNGSGPSQDIIKLMNQAIGKLDGIKDTNLNLTCLTPVEYDLKKAINNYIKHDKKLRKVLSKYTKAGFEIPLNIQVALSAAKNFKFR